MRVTINDIARAAGYSKTAVSFAFNDPGKISTEARERILSVADELGYVPDPVARSLQSRNNGTIGFLLPQPIPAALRNPYLVEVIAGIGEVLNREGLALTLLAPRKGSLLETARSAAVDGLIALGLDPDTEVSHVIRNRRIPLVIIDGPAMPGIPVIGVNDEEAAYLAMRHLIDHGHRSIAVLSMVDDAGPGTERYSATGTSRRSGWSRALQENDLTWDRDVVFLECPNSFAGGFRAADKLVADYSNVTAAAAMSDIIALGFMDGLRRSGVRVPWDVSVIGFDDIPASRMVTPALTTIWQPAQEKGNRAAEAVIAMIAGHSVESQVRFRCRLVMRDTVTNAPVHV